MTDDPTVLILGGTAEARALAAALVATGRPVVSSLAGRVSDPALPAGEVRIGGFGGSAGLGRFLADRRISAVVDATHPFAESISRNAVAACAAAGVPLARLARPGWAAHPDAGGWTWVESHAAAALAAAAVDGVPFLTVGRQRLDDYRPALADRQVLVRVVEAPQAPLPPGWLLLRDRGPYHLWAEIALLREHRIGCLITKDSGGDHTRAKLDAAAALGAAVVVIRRPGTLPGVVTFADIGEVFGWLDGAQPGPAAG